uniref:Secreted Odorant Binding Protein Family protein n=1 Tax=Pristhesancus plagipennis TaxID=1955184 RepID=A0A2K8JWX2_PRIPG|nr:secreted Odorant Binding Protein Family protein [Pristhesancus plagipennis]
MKGFLVICVIGLAVSSTFAVDETIQEKLADIFTKCKKENPLTDAEIEMITKHAGVPSSPKAKCFAKCVYSEGKTLQNGRYNKQAALAFVDSLHPGKPENAKKAKQVIEHCASKIGTTAGKDECDYAYKLSLCGYNKAKELGIHAINWD